ncbi:MULTISPECIES: hypothetical protein [Arsenophonus]|uniref:hypothetical protein n=1 Tax=Arsenophonus TaxID=637 RepID=UPI00387A0389
MKYTNGNGYYDNSCREYFILKAIFFYDSLLELEKEGLVSIIKPSETDKNTNPLLEAINNLAIKAALESGEAGSEYIADDLDVRPISPIELENLIDKPLKNYLLFDI